MILECDGEARAGMWSGHFLFFHGEMKLVDERRVPSFHFLRQATALATSVYVLRIGRIVEVSEGPRMQSINVTQPGEIQTPHVGSMSYVAVLRLQEEEGE